MVAGLLNGLGADTSTGDSLSFDQAVFGEAVVVRDLEQVDRAPQLLAVVMGVMAIGVTVHVLVIGLRANRRDLAVMRTIGFRSGDVGRAIAWQSIVYVAAALAVGTPIGVFAGRIAWRAYAERLGAVPEPLVPWLGLTFVAAVALTLAGTVGLALSRRTTSASPARALRSE